MQFPVPQFIDVEDKIIGPFSIKQFLILFVAGLIDVAVFRAARLSFIFFIVALPVTLLGLVAAFGRFNGRPVYESLSILFSFLNSSKNLVFQKKSSIEDIHIQPITVEQIREANQKPVVEAPPQSRLKELTRLLEEKTAEEKEIVDEKIKEK